jgi:hypothetical protein
MPRLLFSRWTAKKWTDAIFASMRRASARSQDPAAVAGVATVVVAAAAVVEATVEAAAVAATVADTAAAAADVTVEVTQAAATGDTVPRAVMTINRLG